MVVLLVAILAAVSIPQFIDFRSDAKNAATQSALGTMRTAIVNQYAQSSIRCNAKTFAKAAQLNANDITTGTGAPCTAAQVTTTTDRVFVATSALPDNPWSGTTAASKNSVTACTTGGCSPTAATPVNCTGSAFTAGDGGWCYDESNGKIWANSNNSGSNEFLF